MTPVTLCRSCRVVPGAPSRPTRLRRRTLPVLLLLAALLPACGSPGGTGGTTPDAGPGNTVRVLVPAAQGGVLQAGGAKLTIPAGALSQDATVTLDVRDRPAAVDTDPMKPAGPAVAVDLGGATLQTAASLDLPVADATSGTGVVLETRPSNADGEPLLWVHAARTPAALTSAPANRAATSVSTVYRHPVLHTGVYTPQFIPRPTPTELVGAGSLEVPFYAQVGLPWCAPTALAMTLNFFQPLVNDPRFPSGFASNWGLASLIHQDPNSGADPNDMLVAALVPVAKYRWMKWDAELIPNDGAPSDGTYNAFVSYLVLSTTGLFGAAPPRPVLTGSDRQWHFFVVTGVSSDALFINDGNDDPAASWAGHHRSETLADFRAANCRLVDKSDPSKGCIAVGGGSAQPDLYTLLIDAPVKAENARRGSLMLTHGENGYAGSVRFVTPNFWTISDWAWDGHYATGTYFDDAATKIPSFPGVSNLPQDTAYRTSVFRSSQLLASPAVVNVTNIALDYVLEARVETATGASPKTLVKVVTVPPYSDVSVGLDLGTLDTDFAGLTGTFDARVIFTLKQADVVQDVKNIGFSVAPDPTTPPDVQILVPASPITVLLNVPFTFQGRGSDAHTVPDGQPNFEWREIGTTLGTGSTLTHAFTTTGPHIVTLVATNLYGVQAFASVTVTVVDPTLTPGQILILQPVANAAYRSPTTNVSAVDVPLSGAATYSDGSPVPGDHLVWTAQPQGFPETAVGRGSSVTAVLNGGRNTPLPYVIRLTVLSAGGTPIGSTTVNITAVYTYIG